MVRIFGNGRELVEYFTRKKKSTKLIGTGEGAEDPVNAIILDYRMPVMNGLEAAKSLCKLGVRLKIIFVSAFDLPVGASRYYYVFLRKPVMASELLHAVSGIEILKA